MKHVNLTDVLTERPSTGVTFYICPLCDSKGADLPFRSGSIQVDKCADRCTLEGHLVIESRLLKGDSAPKLGPAKIHTPQEGGTGKKSAIAYVHLAQARDAVKPRLPSRQAPDPCTFF